ncbi:MAG: LPS export ABC transporter ATP-binding protein [Nitrospinota bacterium]|nr:MAG: LPS export ABC transporter ATP-binding protein [Nitrospinota bacterium]
MLEAVGLVKAYGGKRVVDAVSLSLQQGEIVGLLGPNGAGKTTTFSMLIGLIFPQQGKILLHQEDITLLPIYQRARKGISYLPQEPSVFRRLTVEENLLAILERFPGSKRERRRRATTLLEEMQIAHLAKRRASSLSGGERRRVEIARALTTTPAFILLDEPFAGIDPIAVSDLQEIIFHLKQRGIGVLITDHRVRETLEITDRAYIIHEGKILASGLPQEVTLSTIVRQIYLGKNFTLK